MQQTSETYKALLAAGAPKQPRVTIYNADGSGGVTYYRDNIVSASTRASMLGSDLTVGACIAKELNLVLRNVNAVPRMAMIRVQYRLYDAGPPAQYSEWINKGIYFVDTREEGNGVVTLDCFDPMLKTDQSYTQSGDQGQWPKTDLAVVQEIASRIGVAVDTRTTEIISRHFAIEYPGYGEDAYTCRDVLGFIGTMYGGNWIITDENKLRLIILGDIPANMTNLLITQTGDYILIGGYRILVSR